MSPRPDLLERVRALVKGEPPLAGDKSGTVGVLQRLCRAAAGTLPATGVGLSLVSAAGEQVRAAASDATSELIEELQFTFGEGPCIDSYTSGHPVLTADVATTGVARWPGYGPAAHARGVRAVFAFPLKVGTARLGILDVYRDRPGGLSKQTIDEAVTFAEVALQALIDPEQHAAQGNRNVISDLDDTGERRFETFQAQGMLMVQLQVNPEEAMARLRAYAYLHDRRLYDVARDLLAGKLTLERDD